MGSGYQDLIKLGKGMSEEQEPNYNVHEEEVMQINNDVRALIKEMEQRTDEIQTQQKT